MRTDKLWCHRKRLIYHFIESGRKPLPADLDQVVRDGMRAVEQARRGEGDFVIPFGDHEEWQLAYLLGELSALWWVLGDEWNNGDS